MSVWQFFQRRFRDQEFNEEIQSHLAMAVQERVDQGEDRHQAELIVKREFGNLTLIRETTRAMWGPSYAEEMLHNLRYGLRHIRSKPGVATVVIASLALGIGASLALFSVA